MTFYEDKAMASYEDQAMTFHEVQDYSSQRKISNPRKRITDSSEKNGWTNL